MAIDIDEDNLKQGLLGLVVALVEIIQEMLEHQALRRMESGRLNESEIERLGNALMELNDALEHIKMENDLEDAVKSVRDGLDSVANDTVRQMLDPGRWEMGNAKMSEPGKDSAGV